MFYKNINIIKVVVFILFTTTFFNISYADSVDFAASSKVAKFEYKVPSDNEETTINTGFSRNNDVGFSLFTSFHSSPGNISDSAFLYSAGISGKIVYSEILESTVIYGLGLDGYLGYRLDTDLPMNLLLKVSYSPEAINWGDASSMYSFFLAHEIYITTSSIIYVGYRNSRVLFKEKNEKLDGRDYLQIMSHFLVGVKIKF